MGDAATNQTATELSLVIPVRDEEPNVEPLCREVLEVFAGRDIAVILVDDGSEDGTFEAVRRLHGEDPRVRGLRLRHPSGKAAAYAAGFAAARGTFVLTMDGDLQDDPRDLLRLLEAREESDADLAVGWKQKGKSSPATFVLSRLMNGLIRLVTRSRLHDVNCPVRVMRREVARSLELRADLHRYIPLLAQAAGARVVELPVANRPRRHGASKYTGSKYFSSAVAFLGMRLYLRYGDRPMHLFGGIGLIAFLIGLIIDLVVTGSFLFHGSDIDDDIPTLLFGLGLVLIGTHFIALGLLAEILVRKVDLVASPLGADIAEHLP